MINNAIIGFGILLSLIIYITFKLDDKHQALKFVFLSVVIFILPTLAIIGSCDFVQSSYYDYNVYGNNFTYENGSATYHWDYSASGIPPQSDKGVFLFHTNKTLYYDRICDEKTQNLMLRPINLVQRVYIIYVFLYTIWVIFNKYFDAEKIMNKAKKW